MTLTTLPRYLIGDRYAILSLAATRHSLWIGLLFVLSAGFAREYDGEDLLSEPWHLFIPLGASLASSFVLFSVAYGVASAKGEPASAFFPRYLSFLGLFWLTAPLAWLYAVPYERILSPYDATSLNLLTLGVVALWRVALMVRVLHVLFGFTLKALLCLVMLFADAVALLLVFLLPIPLIDVMGGVHRSEAEALTQSVARSTLLIGGFTLPAWLAAAVAFGIGTGAKWQTTTAPTRRVGLGIAFLALASVLLWWPVLPVTQPQQQRRRAVERAYQAGDLDEALALTSAHPKEAFPPHWRPPAPTTINDERWVVIIERLAAKDVPPWVRTHYLQRVRWQTYAAHYVPLDTHVLRNLGLALRTTPEGRAVLAEILVDLENELHPAARHPIADALEGRPEKDKR